MTRDEFAHFFNLSVRWGDADLFGHINNTEYIRYLESSRIDYCYQVLGLPYKIGMKQAFIMADIQCSFIEQLHYPAELDVAVRVSRIGNSSAEMQEAIFRKGEDSPVATARTVVVWFDFPSQSSQSIPGQIRDKIIDFERKRPDLET